MASGAIVTCEVHGASQETFVCQHIVDGLSQGRPVGFFWPADAAEGDRPDAWCADCQARVVQVGGEWVGEALENLGAQLLCGGCYDDAKALHMSLAR